MIMPVASQCWKFKKPGRCMGVQNPSEGPQPLVKFPNFFSARIAKEFAISPRSTDYLSRFQEPVETSVLDALNTWNKSWNSNLNSMNRFENYIHYKVLSETFIFSLVKSFLIYFFLRIKNLFSSMLMIILLVIQKYC